MKKALIILMILLLVGCNSKTETKPVKSHEEILKEQLMTYAKEIFERDEWLKGGIREDTYTITLRDLQDHLYKDITQFVNEEEKQCDLDQTKIEFIVEKLTEEGKTNYKYNIVLVC